MKYSYVATAKVGHPIHRSFKLKATKFAHLKLKIHFAMRYCRYYTEGVNGGINPDESEPYTKDLIYPEVKWSITRD